MTLFKANDTATFKQYMNVSFTFDTGNNFFGLVEAEDQHLKNVVGQTLLTALRTNANATNPDHGYDELLSLSRAVVAPLSVLLGISTRHIKIGDTGLKKTSSEKTENVFNWEYREVKEELQNKVALAWDNLYKYLFANAATFEWENPQPYSTIFKTAEDFKAYYPVVQPYRNFPLLLPIIAKVEKLFVHDAIGKDFLAELKENTDDDADTLEAIDLLKSAIAHFTIHKASIDLPVKITAEGFTVAYAITSDEPFANNKTGNGSQLETRRNETLKDGRTFMSKLKKLLNAKASDELFATFFESAYYTAPATERVDRNSTRKGIVRF